MDSTSPQNHKLMSLLNHNLKLFDNVLVNRVIDLLPALIHPDQFGIYKRYTNCSRNPPPTQYHIPYKSHNLFSASVFRCRKRIWQSPLVIFIYKFLEIWISRSYTFHDLGSKLSTSILLNYVVDHIPYDQWHEARMSSVPSYFQPPHRTISWKH